MSIPLQIPVVEMDTVTFSYNGRDVFDGIDLTIRQLDSTCVVGPNGGGKSTLIKLILGLLKPSSGKIKLLGSTPEDARALVGYVPQYAKYDPLFPVTVMDVTLMGRLGRNWGGRYTKNDKQAALEALEEMELADQASTRFSELSGGQQQRVLIARALVSAAQLLILDEPIANVDAHVEVNILEMLTKLNKRMAVILVTHDLGFASQFFETVVCVNHNVHIHPTSDISGELIQELYGADISMIRHDHRCSPGGHIHD